MPSPTLALTLHQAIVEGERATEEPSVQQQTSQAEGEIPTQTSQGNPPSSTQLDKGKGITTTSEPEQSTLQSASTGVLIYQPKVAYEINGVTYMLTNAQIQAHLDREERQRKEAEAERMNRVELIKVVHEEAEQLGLKEKVLHIRKAGEIFKKAQQDVLEAAKAKRDERLKKAAALKQKKIDRYN